MNGNCISRHLIFQKLIFATKKQYYLNFEVNTKKDGYQLKINQI